MYTDVERAIVTRFKAAVPPIYYEQRTQFAQSLPILALFSAILSAILGGWLGAVLAIFRLLLGSPGNIAALLLAPFFWISILPPILWAFSYVPLRGRRLIGWRLFVLGTLLALISSLVGLQIIGILFSGAILYFTLQCYEEFWH